MFYRDHSVPAIPREGNALSFEENRVGGVVLGGLDPSQNLFLLPIISPAWGSQSSQSLSTACHGVGYDVLHVVGIVLPLAAGLNWRSGTPTTITNTTSTMSVPNTIFPK